MYVVHDMMYDISPKNSGVVESRTMINTAYMYIYACLSIQSKEKESSITALQCSSSRYEFYILRYDEKQRNVK